jgi:hypothetical protein
MLINLLRCQNTEVWIALTDYSNLPHHMHITPTNKLPQGCNSGQCHKHIYKEFEAMMHSGKSLDFDWFLDRSYGKFLTLLHQSSLSRLERKSSTQHSNNSLTSSLAIRIWHAIHCGTPVYRLQISSNGAHMTGPGSLILHRSASLAMKGS